jgi:hypothetical protein
MKTIDTFSPARAPGWARCSLVGDSIAGFTA